jgi:hypothetical protein
MKMNLLFKYVVAVLLCIQYLACSNEIKEIDSFINERIRTQVETGKNIRIIYSDSALVRVIVHAPVMERYTSFTEPKDEFPKGILVEFLDVNKKVFSWLKADMAVRDELKKKIIAKGNVEFYNDRQEKLETPELIWDEQEKIIYTDKLVRITQAEKGDTTYGFGFRANQDLSRFEIRKKVQGKVNTTGIIDAFN